MQALIDNLGKVFHLNQPETVNIYGFPSLISRFLHGRILNDHDGLETLLQKVTTLSTFSEIRIPKEFDSGKVASCIAYLFITQLRHHHPFFLDHSSIAFALSGCSFLQEYISANECETILTLVQAAIPMKSLAQSNFPLLPILYDSLVCKMIPIRAVTALIQVGGFFRLGFCHKNEENNPLCISIREIGERSVLQFKLQDNSGHLSIICPQDFCKALETVISHIDIKGTEDQKIEDLLQILESLWVHSTSTELEEPVLMRYKQIRKLDTGKLEQEGIKLLSSSNRFCKYIGYLLLLVCGNASENENLVSLLLQNFITAFNFRKDPIIRSMLYTQFIYILKKTKYAPIFLAADHPLQKFFESSLKLTNPKKSLQLWVEALAECQEEMFSKVAYDLWNKFSSQYESKIEISVGLVGLIRSFVKCFPNYAKDLFQSLQEDKKRPSFDVEFKVIGTLLKAFKLKGNFSLEILHQLTQIVEKFFSRRLSSNSQLSQDLIDSFITVFSWLFDRLYELNQFEQCLSLLVQTEKQGLITSQNLKIKQLWITLCETKTENDPSNFLNKLHDLGIVESWKIEEKQINFWIGLCKWYCRRGDYDKAVSMWEKITDLHSPENIHNIESLIYFILDTLTNVLSKDHHLKTILTIFKHRSPYACSESKKYEYTRQCLTKAAPNKSIMSHTLLLAFFTEFLTTLEMQSEEMQASLMVDFLKLSWEPDAPLPKVTKEKIRNLFPTVIRQMHTAGQFAAICSFLQLLHLHDIQVEYSSETARQCLSALSKNIECNNDDLDHVKELEILVKKLQKLLPSDLLEWLPVYGNLVDHYIDFKMADQAYFWINQAFTHPAKQQELQICWLNQLVKFDTKIGYEHLHLLANAPGYAEGVKPATIALFEKHLAASPLNAAIFFLAEHSLLLKARNAREWQDVISEIIRQLVAKGCNVESTEKAFHLLKNQNILNANFWKLCFDQALALKDNNLFKLAWTTYQESTRENTISGTLDEMALSWASMLQVLDHIPDADFLSFLDAAVDPGYSLFFLAFDGLGALKMQIWPLIIRGSLKCTNFDNPTLVATKVFQLRSQLPEYQADKLVELLHLDCFIITHLLAYCQEEPIFNLIWARLEKMLNIEGNHSGLIGEMLNSVLSALHKAHNWKGKNYLTEIRTILIHKSTRESLGNESYSQHWGKYLLVLPRGREYASISEKDLYTFFGIVKHYPYLRHHQETELFCMKRCLDIAIVLIETDLERFGPLLVLFFNSLATHIYTSAEVPKDEIGLLPDIEEIDDLITSHGEMNVFAGEYFICNKDHRLERVVTHSFHCKNPKLIDPNLTLFRKEFFKYFSLLLHNVINKTLPHSYSEYPHYFFYKNISFLMSDFPEYHKEIVHLLESFIFWPEGNTEFLLQ